MGHEDRATALLTVDLDAIADNWLALRGRLRPGASCAGVVKANAYGLGARKVVPALLAAGCRDFVVAQIDEGLDILDLLPADARLFVLSGPPEGAEDEVLDSALIPVLNSPDQIDRWAKACARAGRKAPAALHVDTGMRRLGLTPLELDALLADPRPLAAFTPVLVMTHLACADEPDHPLNAEQRALFAAAAARFPGLRASLANTSGIFLGPEWHFDLARPGIGLYGGNPTVGTANPMRQVVKLQGKILQVRRIDTPLSVGYGATHTAPAGSTIATVGVGYADGFPRSAGNRAMGLLAGRSVPVVGRVSMDLLTFDVSDVPENLARPGAMIDLLGPDLSVDALADRADTVSYEILTRLGARYPRRYGGVREGSGQ
ncbi:alanine racemase [Rhodospirillum rubrum]|uniref:Alanine racemase n=1 Tax=Rhodospirillum rubrum (strain ATCC 11170 / ATH 1.1.1 / DSM 467 / LMG 4362 / NCIMB 8255 / S1) TaxID=269796 RepID=ALR_RHORT|nr:alanine racemase [Rhodospirillum rubrum]Q2RXD1.1 RecName: Full=Alanine racemase [Rhodospirillum rubrum ATCC 11170]ABC21214.1 alanine racemase [Rhodospirillum rubrum ATCC 11170]AEO46889.1 alanine racemase [Rhodospirillum rubrum F11]MBK5952766.1 alanine racemase [Rhodospirillum rubrum]HAQ00866.1 alanine racemase [Rhodospirillum rubrum]